MKFLFYIFSPVGHAMSDRLMSERLLKMLKKLKKMPELIPSARVLSVENSDFWYDIMIY